MYMLSQMYSTITRTLSFINLHQSTTATDAFKNFLMNLSNVPAQWRVNICKKKPAGKPSIYALVSYNCNWRWKIVLFSQKRRREISIVDLTRFQNLVWTECHSLCTAESQAGVVLWARSRSSCWERWPLLASTAESIWCLESTWSDAMTYCMSKLQYTLRICPKANLRNLMDCKWCLKLLTIQILSYQSSFSVPLTIFCADSGSTMWMSLKTCARTFFCF